MLMTLYINYYYDDDCQTNNKTAPIPFVRGAWLQGNAADMILWIGSWRGIALFSHTNTHTQKVKRQKK